MYVESRLCSPETCEAYCKAGIKLPIVDVSGSELITPCLRLAMKGVKIDELNTFSRNYKDAIRSCIQELLRENAEKK